MNIGEFYAHGVGLKKPNAWGLHDMHGNVYEWCRDWYTTRLPGGRNPEVTTRASFRVFRGGSWLNSGWSCRSANRFWYAPGFRDGVMGFRVAAVRSSQ